MIVDIVNPGLAGAVLGNLDLDRAVELVRHVCRIPSVLGGEGELAGFLASVMRASGFGSVELQDVLPGRPNALGEVSFGPGPRVVLTGHLDTKPESHGWQRAAPFSGDLIDGAVYGHGVMDMKAALACQIVAIEAVRASQLPLSGTVAMAAVADHMGEQAGSIAYFDTHQADLCLLGELTGNQVCLGHRGRYYFDVTVRGRSAHTCHKHAAVNANVLAAQAVLALDRSRLEPDLADGVAELFGAETYIVPGRIYGGLPPGGPSMIPDECVIRVDCRPQPLEVDVEWAAGPEGLDPHPGHREVPDPALGGAAAGPAGPDEQAGELDDGARLQHHRRHRAGRFRAGQVRRRHAGHERDPIACRYRFGQPAHHAVVGPVVGEQHHLLAGADSEALIEQVVEPVRAHRPPAAYPASLASG